MTNGYAAARSCVLSDPAQVGDERGRPDEVRFWVDVGIAGLEATAARFRRYSFRPHTHDVLMLGLIDVGVKSFARERKSYIAEHGTVSVVNPGDLHTGSPVGDETLRYRALYVPANLLWAGEDGSEHQGELGFRSGVIADEPVFQALGRLHSSIIAKADRLIRDELLSEALALLTDRHGSLHTSARKRVANAPGAIRRAYGIIAERFDEDLSASEIAAAAGLSPYHLMRLFRREVGIPMHTLQTQLRVERGKTLLRRGLPAAEVAQEVGFADQSHFSRRFKAIVGAPPAAYQRAVLSS